MNQTKKDIKESKEKIKEPKDIKESKEKIKKPKEINISFLFKYKKYFVQLIRKENNIPTIIKTIRIKPIDVSISYKKNLYPINFNEYTYTKGLKVYYLIDIDSKKQLSFQKLQASNIDVAFLDNMIMNHIIRDLTMGLSTMKFKLQIGILLLGCLIGGLFGFILKMYV